MLVYHGTLVNELDSGANLEALLMYDPDLFANMVLPVGLDKMQAISTIRHLHGLAPLYHPDPFYMKGELYWWSKRLSPIWAKLYATTQLSYNPIWNTEMTEKSTDTTTTDRDTSTQSDAHSHGGATDTASANSTKGGWNTEDGAYHEDTAADGWKTDDATQHSKTVHDGWNKEDGHYHDKNLSTAEGEKTRDFTEDIVGTLDSQVNTTSHTGVVGTRDTNHDETMTDTIDTTKNTVSDTENKLSAENEATYQPDNASHTVTDEKGHSDETRKTNWTEHEATTQNTDFTQDVKTDQDTTQNTENHAFETSRDLSTSDTHGDTHSAASDGTVDDTHAESISKDQHADKGTTKGGSVKKNQYDDRTRDESLKDTKHNEHSVSLETGKENTTVTVTHEYSKSGNIGVTTTQQMIEAERAVVLFDIYAKIADDFHRAFCLDCY